MQEAHAAKQPRHDRHPLELRVLRRHQRRAVPLLEDEHVRERREAARAGEVDALEQPRRGVQRVAAALAVGVGLASLEDAAEPDENASLELPRLPRLEELEHNVARVVRVEGELDVPAAQRGTLTPIASRPAARPEPSCGALGARAAADAVPPVDRARDVCVARVEPVEVRHGGEPLVPLEGGAAEPRALERQPVPQQQPDALEVLP